MVLATGDCHLKIQLLTLEWQRGAQENEGEQPQESQEMFDDIHLSTERWSPPVMFFGL